MRTQEDQDREKYCKHPIFGTDLSKPTSECIEEVRRTILKARGQISDIMSGKGFEDRLKHVEGLLTCGLVALYSEMEEAFENEIKMLDHKLGPSLAFGTRGIGLDITPGCFVCGITKRNPEANDYLHNIAAHLDEKEADAVMLLFPRGARMGYYHGDKSSPQIKIGACDLHLPNLAQLHEATKYYRRIRAQDVLNAIDYK